MRLEIVAMKSWDHSQPCERSTTNSNSSLRHDRTPSLVDARFRPKNFPAVRFGVFQFRKTASRFEHHDREAALRQFLCHKAAARSRADDDDVCGFRSHVNDGSVSA